MFALRPSGAFPPKAVIDDTREICKILDVSATNLGVRKFPGRSEDPEILARLQSKILVQTGVNKAKDRS